jgi:acyl-CoA dehydrogenase
MAVREAFGSKTPFAEPGWYQGRPSPYYKEEHVAFRNKVRAFVDAELMPHWKQWDEQGSFPVDLHKKAYDAGVYSWRYPRELGGTPPCDPEKFDHFFNIIFQDELARVPAGGITASLFSHGIGLPPLLAVGSDYIKQKYAAPIIRAEMVVSLAITEPGAGSDVANVSTKAVREGDYYIVNGVKKFITGARDTGSLPSCLTTAVRTGAEGRGGISLLLIESNTPGVTIRRLKTQGWWASHTALITFEDVKVPVANIVGRENQGFLPIMMNFNMERFNLCLWANRCARTCLEEAILYARKRKTFGKPLMSHDLIRWKMVEMIRAIEANHAWLEQIAFQMDQRSDPQALGAVLSLCKISCTDAVEKCAKEASQVFGGASYLRQGQGEKIESIYRDVRVLAIGGGSAEVMGLLGTRLAML